MKKTLKILDITSIVKGEDGATFGEIYSEAPGEQSEAKSTTVDDGRVIVVGDTQRVTGVAHRSPDYYLDSYLTLEVQFEPYVVYEGLILVFDSDGTILGRERLVAGSDVFLTAAGTVGNQVVVGGIIAGRSAIATIDLLE